MRTDGKHSLTTPARTARERAGADMARLTRSSLGNDDFRYAAVETLRKAVGFDWWGWTLLDPGTRLPARDLSDNAPPAKALRRFFRLVPNATDWAVAGGTVPTSRPAAICALSAATGGDMTCDPSWREMEGPAGCGDRMDVPLIANGVCWAQLHLGRDSTARWFSDEDTAVVTRVAPLLTARLLDAVRAQRAGTDPDPEPGTIFLDRDLSLVAATEDAWRWIGRLGLPQPNDDEPLPGFLYAVATRAALGPDRSPRSARVRLQDAGGRWVVVRAAPHPRTPPGTTSRPSSARRGPTPARSWPPGSPDPLPDAQP